MYMYVLDYLVKIYLNLLLARNTSKIKSHNRMQNKVQNKLGQPFMSFKIFCSTN